MTTESEYYDGPKYIGPTDCAFCGENLDDAEEQGPFTADAWKALNDVRTLDESGFAWESGFFHVHEVKTYMCVVLNEEQVNFTGSTPDNARARAAAWVRGLK